MGYNASDKEQIEEIKNWWKDYGKAITIAVVVGLVIGFGWRYWSRYETTQHDRASGLYMQLLTQSAAGKAPGAVDQNAQQIKTAFGGSPYAALASMLQAKNAVAQQDYKKAISDLDWVITNSKNVSFQAMARIRQARIYVQLKQYDKAKQVLAAVSDKSFSPAVDAVKRSIDDAQGVKTAA